MMAARSAALFACCLWGALGGWAAAAVHAAPGPALVVYGAAAWFGSGYLLGSTTRARPPSSFDLRLAAFTAAPAFALKAMAPALAAWTAVLIAGAAFGVVAGVMRTK